MLCEGGKEKYLMKASLQGRDDLLVLSHTSDLRN